ncbi:MFS transporter [Streptomyces sp. NPDC057638]|uniref:MFS transporter n=1 Tax=Streptomyces sp. NPDC057638 TaxID=3346190 RepID=UPI003676E667
MSPMTRTPQGAGPPRTPLPARVRVGYGLGSFATGTYGTVPGLVLLYYLTDVLGVAAGLAGLLVFLPKAWEVLVSPWLGGLSDRTGHRWGPRTPWMALGALTAPLCFAALFAAPTGLGPTGSAVYVTAAFLLTATAFACFQVPYIALPAEFTTDPDERTRVQAWRVAFLCVTILATGALAPVLAGVDDDRGGTPGGYRLMGLAAAVLILAGMTGALAATVRTRSVLAVTGESGTRVRLRALRGERDLTALLGANLLQGVATGTMLAGTQFFATYTLGRPAATSLLFLALILPSLPAMPLWLAAARRTGKRRAALAATVCFLTGAGALGLARGMPDAWVYGALALAGVGYAGVQMLPIALYGDAIAADTLRRGRPRAGALTGLWMSSETLGLALGPVVYGLVLTAGGFVPSDATEKAAQPGSALGSVVLGFGAVPALLLLLSLPVLARYRPPH